MNSDSIPDRVAAAVRAAKRCDLDVDTDLPGPTGAVLHGEAPPAKSWQRSATMWSARVVDPLKTFSAVALAMIAWVTTVLVLVRFALVRPPRAFGSRKAGWRRTWIALGLALVLGSAVLAFVLLGVSPEDGASSRLLVAAGVALLGALLLTWGLCRGARLSIRADRDGLVERADLLRMTIKRMGGSSGGGPEMPVGPDLTFLKDVGVSTDSGNVVVAAAARLLSLAVPPEPWVLRLRSGDERGIVHDLTHLGRSCQPPQITADMVLGELDSIDGIDQVESPAVVGVAAHTVYSMADTKDRGLAGASNWEGIALQYLGARLPWKSALRQPLFGAAVAKDPANVTARLSYWHSLYRDAFKEGDLKRFEVRLTSLLDAKAKSVHLSDDMRFRLEFNRVVTVANLAALVRSDDAHLHPDSCQSPQCSACARCADSKDLDARARTLYDALLKSTESKKKAKDSLRVAMHAVVKALGYAVPPFGTSMQVAEREDCGPGLNYIYACAYAQRGHLEEAKQRLTLAVVDPALKESSLKDPMLAQVTLAPSSGEVAVQTTR